jgi:hypothetical protein
MLWARQNIIEFSKNLTNNIYPKVQHLLTLEGAVFPKDDKFVLIELNLLGKAKNSR